MLSAAEPIQYKRGAGNFVTPRAECSSATTLASELEGVPSVSTVGAVPGTASDTTPPVLIQWYSPQASSRLATGTVEYLADERKQASLDGYFAGLTPGQRAQIQAVAMDMWEPYVQSVQTHVPQADRKIVFDVFHILQHMNAAVDHVRRREHRLLRAQGDETLTGSKYVWLYGEENVPDRHRERFTELTQQRSRKRSRSSPRGGCNCPALMSD